VTPPPAAPPPPDVVDAAMLDALRELVGPDDPNFLVDLLKTFLEHADRAVADLREATKAGARDRVRAMAHSLKGSAGNVGAKPLAALAESVEAAAKRATGDLSAGVEALVIEVARVRIRLQREIDGGRAN
jgi:histidine phosphotransfer protein HptB